MATTPPTTCCPAPVPRRDWVLLALFCVALAVLHALWVEHNGWIRASDEAIHHLGALRLHRALLGEESLGQVLLPSARALWRTGADQSLYYPPLTYLFTAVSFYAFGDTVQAADLSLLPFHLLLTVGLWLLGRRVAGPRVAWLAALLGATSPALLSYGRTYFLELPAAAWLVWAVLCLERSRSFARAGWTLGFALCAVAGLFSRWNFALFLAAPTLVVLVQAAWAGWRGALPPRRLPPLVFGAALLLPFGFSASGLALTGEHDWSAGGVLPLHALWWAVHGAGVAGCLALGRRWPAWRSLAQGVAAIWLVAGLAAPLYLVFSPLLAAKYFVMFGTEAHSSFGWYLQAVLTFHWLAWLLLPLGLSWSLVQREPRQRLRLVLVTLGGGLLATVSVTDTNVRYVLLLVPFAAIAAVGWAQSWPRVGRAVLPLVVLVAGWQAGGWWALDRWPGLRALPLEQAPILNIGEEHRWELPAKLLPRAAAAPLPEVPPLDAILDAASTWSQGRPPSLAMLDTRITPTPLEADWWRYHAYRTRRPAHVAQINAPWFDPPQAEQLLWIGDDTRAFPFVAHVLGVWGGWDLRPLESVELGGGARAWLFDIRRRPWLPREEILHDLPGLLEQRKTNQLGPGWVYGRVLARGEGWIELSVLGRPLRFALAPAWPLDPALRPGSWASLTHRGSTDAQGAVLASEVRPAYTPTRFREGMDYPPPPPARPPRDPSPCARVGQVEVLLPEALVLAGGEAVPLGRSVGLPAAELFPGTSVCLDLASGAGGGTRIGLLPPGGGDTQPPP